tara:strand:+ start:231 stop:566 length:336 start_codon:yes stop_codon:yes gene_type:complete
MNPGEFRHKVSIVVNAETQQSDYGDYKRTSNTSYSRYAKVKWLQGSEKIEAETISLQKNVEFMFRFESVTEFIDRIDTILLGTDTFQISSIQYKGHANQQYVIIRGNTFTD